MTVNEASSHLCKILTLIIVKTYLQTEETLPHRSSHRCNMLKAIFHQRETGKLQRNNYHHGSCGPSLTGKTW